MFGFEKNSAEWRGRMMRIVDRSAPNLPFPGGSRADVRSNRSIPILLVPYEDNRLRVDEATTAVTKDLSESGLSLVMMQPFRVERVLVGFRVAAGSIGPEEPADELLLSGVVQDNVPIGGGYWQLCIALEREPRPSDLNDLDRLNALLDRLIPQQRASELPTAASIR